MAQPTGTFIPGFSLDPNMFSGTPLDPKFLPLNLDSLGIGTPNTSDSSHADGAATATGAKTPAGTGNPIADAVGGLEHWFVRGVVIILGFIFVAVGLSMFRGNTIIETIKSPAKAVT